MTGAPGDGSPWVSEADPILSSDALHAGIVAGKILHFTVLRRAGGEGAVS
jgi:hypothetical protein